MRWEDWDLGIKLLLFTDRIVWVQTPPLVNVYLHADSITGYRYVPNVPDILRAIAQAHEDVERSDSAQKARLHKLLLYKQMVVAGLCRKEKSPLGTEIYRSTMESAGKDRTMRWFLSICLLGRSRIGYPRQPIIALISRFEADRVSKCILQWLLVFLLI